MARYMRNISLFSQINWVSNLQVQTVNLENFKIRDGLYVTR